MTDPIDLGERPRDQREDKRANAPAETEADVTQTSRTDPDELLEKWIAQIRESERRAERESASIRLR